jgi:hypothetical protein
MGILIAHLFAHANPMLARWRLQDSLSRANWCNHQAAGSGSVVFSFTWSSLYLGADMSCGLRQCSNPVHGGNGTTAYRMI